jgi:large subunit ribosomal protein L19
VKNIPIRYVPVTKEEIKERSHHEYNPDIRFKYPDFLPHPFTLWRNPIREKLERSDMLKRRFHIDIPEFYVG